MDIDLWFVYTVSYRGSIFIPVFKILPFAFFIARDKHHINEQNYS
jgi:hypothetical protein